MALTDLAELLRDEPALAQVLGRRQAVLAVPEAARPPILGALARWSKRRPILVVTPTSTDAERLASDLATVVGDDAVETYPAWETLPFERISPGVETMGRRLRVLWRLADAERTPEVIVAPVRALLQRVATRPGDINVEIVRPGAELDQAAFVERLVTAGYRREYQVEHRGEVAVRGSIVDVFASTADAPVRIDWWGDEIDRLSAFSVADQRSTDDLDVVEIVGCREMRVTPEVAARAAELARTQPWGREVFSRFAEGETFDGMESWLPWFAPDDTLVPDLLDADAQVILVEPSRMRDRAGDLLAEEADLATHLARTTWDVGDDTELPQLHLDFDRLLARTEAPAWTMTLAPEGPDVATVQAVGWNPATGDGAGILDQLAGLIGDGARVVAVADTEASAGRIGDLLASRGVDIPVEVGELSRGVILPAAGQAGVAVLTEADLSGRRRSHRRPRARRRDAARFFDDLQPGDHVVHHTHGVARYEGMVTRTIGGASRDYLLLAYKGDDRLYIPSDQIDAVRHYTGGDTPTLSKLGGGDWTRTKAKVRSEVEVVAQELVVLYQKRLNSAGHAFAEDSPWQRELEDSFAYRETPDQAKAITDTKVDMEAEVPMDRLICGDVGFGKTEVALRAAFKAVQDGKQVAMLVPTTLLAQQHFATFSDRFAAYPLRVEVLSRFLTPAQARSVIEGIRSGEVDLVIGTHRLLSSDITFADLGLLITDEEQHFGVTHKEQIKQLRANVDALTLTATPIPRTLEMSLTGIRDLTLLQTPPAERQPILTYVGDYDERAVAEAIRRELLREGQVFFVHNRVADIDDVAAELRELVPEARVAVAHGQMDEGTLEQVVLDFWDGQFDVLVCTTIIESGIDMPTVNTLVVDRAHRLGLGQLHQLRGRVGRAGARAYAYLFHPRDVSLSEDAYERLKTVGESTELGSGFRIAMRDLEIRGAGTLLGTGQSGHIAAVGYDLYCQMVNEAVAELSGEAQPEPAEVRLDLPLEARLGDDYIPREELRLEAYRRLTAVTTTAEVDDIRAEWQDRYGPPPEPAERLLDVARLRVECRRIGLGEVTVTKGPAFGGPAFTARLSPITLRASQEIRLKRLFPKAVYKEDQGQVQLPVPKTPDLAGTLVGLLADLMPPATTVASS